jgi:hypothetical protein
MRKSRALSVVSFFLVLALFALWSVPSISTYLGSLQSITQTNSVLAHLQSDATSQPSASAGSRSQPNKMQFWQVGLEAGVDDVDAVGARAIIQTRLPQQVSGNTTNYFWVGAYLGDGSFIQAGYFVPWYDETHAGWFYCAFYPSGREGPCVYGASGSAGGNGANHRYTLEATTGASDNVSWEIFFDEVIVGKFAWSSGTTGSYDPMMYAESSGFGPHPGTSRLGPVDFVSGLEVLHAGQTRFQPATQLYVIYSAPAVCPPYGVARDGHGGFLLGSGLPCPALHTGFALPLTSRAR